MCKSGDLEFFTKIKAIWISCKQPNTKTPNVIINPHGLRRSPCLQSRRRSNTHRLAPISHSTLTSEGHEPGHTDRSVVDLACGLVLIHHAPTEDGYGTWATCGDREGRGIGVKPRSVLTPSQWPVVSVNNIRLVYTKLLKSIRGVALTVLRDSPARDDIDIVIHIEVLENILWNLPVDGHVISVIGSDLDLDASDGELPEPSAELLEPRRVIDSYGGADTRVDSSVIIPIDGDVVVTITQCLGRDHVELSTCALGLKVDGLRDRRAYQAIAWSSSTALCDSPFGCPAHPLPLARGGRRIRSSRCSLFKKSRWHFIWIKYNYKNN